MRFKRWLPWVAAALVAALVAGVAVAGTGSSSPDAKRKPTAVKKKLKVGLVTDIGGLNDRGFNQLAYQGLKRAIKNLKVDGRVLTSSGPNDYIPNFTSLVQKKYDLVIGVGFLMTNALDTVAAKFPKTKFAIVDVDVTSMKHKPKNAQGILFKEQEVGYLAGYLAALRAKETGRIISSVGGIKIPPVDRFIAGYQAGAKRAVPGTQLLNGYSQDFVAQDKCKEVALAQIAQGSKVVFQVAGGCGLGALDAAKEKSVCGIGVDNDQGFLGKHILTSARKKVDVGVFLTIKSAQAGKFKGGRNVSYGLANNGVGLGKFGCGYQASWLKAVNSVATQIKAGKIKIPTTVP